MNTFNAPRQDSNLPRRLRRDVFLSCTESHEFSRQSLLKKEQRNYVTILKALASGAATPTEISPKTGMPASQIPQ